ncbi:MAG: hypothetical protein GVX78_04220 [Bacteroidetes bacterium]|nr:hypothetical protein [Bacteroidota bacterium]
MEIEPIVLGGLYAIKWPESGNHCLDEMAERLTDVEYLYEYFEKNEDKLSFYGDTIDNAVRKTIAEADELIQELLDLANAESAAAANLDELFMPLHKVEAFNHSRFYTDFKAKGYKAPWVRIYAVKCEPNNYVITGYGIKLVRRMQDDAKLYAELKKLERATNFLKENGIL